MLLKGPPVVQAIKAYEETPRFTAEHAEIAEQSLGNMVCGLGGLCGERRLSHNLFRPGGLGR
jgi:hypothetical protein